MATKKKTKRPGRNYWQCKCGHWTGNAAKKCTKCGAAKNGKASNGKPKTNGMSRLPVSDLFDEFTHRLAELQDTVSTSSNLVRQGDQIEITFDTGVRQVMTCEALRELLKKGIDEL